MSTKEETIEEKLSYRDKLIVTHALYIEGSYTFPICPKCNRTLEREYQAFCDRCGQCLGWKNYYRAKIIFANEKDRL